MYGSLGKLPVLVCSTHLMILDLAPHYTEGIVARMVVDVDSAEARGSTRWDPLLIGIIIHHDSSSCLADTLFTAGTQRQREKIIIHQVSTDKQSDPMVKRTFQLS